MKIRVRKLHKDAVIPSYAKQGDAGLDLTAVSREDKNEDDGIKGYTEYGIGLAFEIPEGHAGFIFPRSSITSKPMILKNSVGVIDAGYRGEVKLRFLADQDEEESQYKVGERVAQLIVMPIPHVTLIESEELSDSVRGEGGYGSTGK